MRTRARYVRTASCVVRSLHDPAAWGLATMPPRTRGQLRLEAEAGGGWAALLEDLLPTILEAMQAAGRRAWEPQEEGLGFSKATAVVREVCSGWQASA